MAHLVPTPAVVGKIGAKKRLWVDLSIDPEALGRKVGTRARDCANPLTSHQRLPRSMSEFAVLATLPSILKSVHERTASLLFTAPAGTLARCGCFGCLRLGTACGRRAII